MTGLDDIILKESEELETVSIMLEDYEDLDTFISDDEFEQISSEICPMCGQTIDQCECDEDDDELYYDEEELEDEMEELDETFDDYLFGFYKKGL